jgi:hypothetical protein
VRLRGQYAAAVETVGAAVWKGDAICGNAVAQSTGEMRPALEWWQDRIPDIAGTWGRAISRTERKGIGEGVELGP